MPKSKSTKLEKVKCPICGKEYTDELNIILLQHGDYCNNCNFKKAEHSIESERL